LRDWNLRAGACVAGACRCSREQNLRSQILLFALKRDSDLAH